MIIRHRFHEVRALRALMHAARAPRENGELQMYDGGDVP